MYFSYLSRARARCALGLPGLPECLLYVTSRAPARGAPIDEEAIDRQLRLPLARPREVRQG